MEKKKTLTRALTLMVICLLVSSFRFERVEAESSIVYVDANNINDPLEDGSLEHPFDTIQEGIDIASSGDTIYVKAGTYGGLEPTIHKSNLLLIGEDTASVIINTDEGSASFYLDGANNVTFKHFTLIPSGGYGAGFYVTNAQYINITENRIYTGGCGVYLGRCNHCSVTNNAFEKFSEESFEGVYLYDTRTSPPSPNNQVSGNNFTSQVIGIEMAGEGSSNTLIFQNNFVNSTYYGLFSYERARDCKIFHNNFIDNGIQVDEAFSNVYDDGYPSGGNYWSDYTGVDLCSGPYQNETGIDGIGDTAYTVSGYSHDSYPLMNPWAECRSIPVPIKGGENATITGNVTIAKALVTKNSLHFEASGPSGQTGWVNVAFPMVNTTVIRVFINGTKLTPPPYPSITTNGTHYFIYFEFTLSTHSIAIQYANPGDLNEDGVVNVIDSALVSSHWYPGPPIGPSGYDPNFDINNDGSIDILDVAIVSAYWTGPPKGPLAP